MDAPRKPRLILSCAVASLRPVVSVAAPWFELVAARDTARLLRAVNDDPGVAAVLVETTPIGGDALQALEEVRSARPDVRRVLMTDRCDLALIVNGLHSGIIDAIVYQPPTPLELTAALCPQALPVGAGPASRPPVVPDVRTASQAAG